MTGAIERVGNGKLTEIILCLYLYCIIIMSHPSQIFQANDDPQPKLFQLQSQLEELRHRNVELTYQNAKLKERIDELQLQRSISDCQSKQLYDLSKAYLRLGQLAINNNKHYRLDNHSIQQNDEMQSPHGQKDEGSDCTEQRLQGREVKDQESKLKMLQKMLKQREMSLEVRQVQNKNLRQEVQQLKEQFRVKILDLQKKLQELRQDKVNRDYILHNEREINEAKIKLIEKRQEMFKKAQQKMQLRQKQQAELSQQSVVKLQNLKLHLQQQYTKKQQQLELLYNKKLSSLRDYSELEDENQILKHKLGEYTLQLTELGNEKDVLIDRIRKKNKMIEQYKNQIEYQEGIYQSENVDNLIVDLYESKLQKFSKTLEEMGEEEIYEKLQSKKQQLLQGLKRNLNKSILRSTKK